MRFRKRRQEAEAAAEPADAASTGAPPTQAPPVTSWTAPAPAPAPEPVPEPEPVVEGVAVELPPDERPSSPIADRIFEALPHPVAEQPVVAAPAPEPVPVTSLGDSGEAYAAGHGPAPGPMWPAQLEQIARERPEYVVGAAFAGGLLAAMILRRLGN